MYMATEQMIIREYEAGKTIIRENRFGNEMYVLLKGAVEVSVEDVVIAKIDSRGTFIGEISALMGTRRIATVKTIEPSKFYVIDNLNTYFENNPDSAYGMARTLASRLIDMNESFVEMKKSFMSLKEKLNEALNSDVKEIESIQSIISNIDKNIFRESSDAAIPQS